MKKSILTAILAGVMLLSGCSGVSEESYNSVVAENERLKSENNSLKSDNESLSISNKVSEDLLKEYGQEIADLKKQLNEQSESEANPNNSDTSSFVYADFTRTAKEFTIDETGNKWWHDDMNTFVSYVEENEYLHKSDDELVVNAYYDMLKCVVDYPSSLIQFYVFAISKKDGSCVAMGFLSVTGEGDNKKLSTSLKWSGEFSRLNTNPQQIEIFGQPD